MLLYGGAVVRSLGEVSAGTCFTLTGRFSWSPLNASESESLWVIDARDSDIIQFYDPANSNSNADDLQWTQSNTKNASNKGQTISSVPKISQSKNSGSFPFECRMHAPANI